MRIISRLDIKNEFVIKGINLEGLRKIGDPYTLSKKYYNEGVDEIILIDSVASLYSRNNLFHIVEKTVKDVFIPITLGGGIRSLKDISKALGAGADKIAINSYATENPNFINTSVNEFGSSTITIYIEAKKVGEKKWEVYKNYGRDKTGIDLIYWLNEIQDKNCGEILLTSIDHEGMQNGFDIELLNEIYELIKKPLIFSGGCGKLQDINEIKKNYKNVSLSIASAFHYEKIKLNELK
jgi:imidazole glycerol-phosphate synthase subunit HisF